METPDKKVKYPENLPLRGEVAVLGLKIKDLAEEIGCSRIWLSRVLAGKEEGKNAVRQLKEIIKRHKTGEAE